MIASLRRRHGSLVALLGGVGLAGLLAAFGARLPPPAGVVDDGSDREAWTAIDEAGAVRAIRERQAGREWLLVERRATFTAPDVLLYWATRPPAEGKLPDGSALIGPLGDVGARRHDLPASEAGGVLILYSLGHSTVVASRRVDAIRRVDHDPRR